MSSEQSEFQERRARAIHCCQVYIDWYERTKRNHRLAFQSLQVSTATLSIATPLLALLVKPRFLSALSAATLGLITSVDRIFLPKDTYLRFAHVSEILKYELLKFETRTTDEYDIALDEQVALDNFVQAISIVTTTEVSAWRSQRQ